MHINLHYTPTTAHYTAFHNPPLHTTNTKHICVSGGKMAQDVGMVKVLWCHSHLVNPWHACAARVTVLSLCVCVCMCVCVCVCVSVTQHLTFYVIIHATNNTNLSDG